MNGWACRVPVSLQERIEDMNCDDDKWTEEEDIPRCGAVLGGAEDSLPTVPCEAANP